MINIKKILGNFLCVIDSTTTHKKERYGPIMYVIYDGQIATDSKDNLRKSLTL